MTNRFYGDFDYEHLHPSSKRSESDLRNPFQVDRDRVLFSNAFRQLQSKTQVFQSGEYDFYRTRLTHTIEVARIARSIAEYLNLSCERLRSDFFIDPDLVEAVGLAHDLGHPPFGHIGERKLNELMRDQGGFEGNAQTLRILTRLIYARPKEPKGMNPTRAFIDGVLKYKALYSELRNDVDGRLVYPANHFLYDEQEPFRSFVFGEQGLPESIRGKDFNSVKSIECQIMDWADDTAYSLHDIVDGIKAGFITPDRLREWGEEHERSLSDNQLQVLERLIEETRKGGFEPMASVRIGQFIHACSLQPCEGPLGGQTNRYRFKLTVERPVNDVCQLHKRIAIDLIFKSAPLQEIEFKGGRILEKLFRGYVDHGLGRHARSLNIIPEPFSAWLRNATREDERLRLVCDLLSGMTDGQALRAYRRLFEPEFGPLTDYH
ncbi:MAG: dNTP triphosphohydrolase [Opitutales bacterium]|nr:dNTP triphosphohydrolase [Opitutales bacterium]